MRTSGNFADALTRALAGRVFDRQPRPGERPMGEPIARTIKEGRVGETPNAPAVMPSVGRVVHYVAYGTPGGEFPAGVCRAAVITEVDTRAALDETDPPGTYVGLCVLNPTGQFFNRGIPYDPNKAPGTWHWPERA